MKWRPNPGYYYDDADDDDCRLKAGQACVR